MILLHSSCSFDFNFIFVVIRSGVGEEKRGVG